MNQTLQRKNYNYPCLHGRKVKYMEEEKQKSLAKQRCGIIGWLKASGWKIDLHGSTKLQIRA